MDTDKLQEATDLLRKLTDIQWRVDVSDDDTKIMWDNVLGTKIYDSQHDRLRLLRRPPLNLEYIPIGNNERDITQLDIDAQWVTQERIDQLTRLVALEPKRRKDGPHVAALLTCLTDIPWEWDGDNVRTKREYNPPEDTLYNKIKYDPELQGAVGLSEVFKGQHGFVLKYDLEALEQAVQKTQQSFEVDNTRKVVKEIFGAHQHIPRGGLPENVEKILYALEILTGMPWRMHNHELTVELPNGRPFSAAQITRIQHVSAMAGMQPFYPVDPDKVVKMEYSKSEWNKPSVIESFVQLAKAEPERRKNAPLAAPLLTKYTGIPWIWNGLNLMSSEPLFDPWEPERHRAAQQKLADLGMDIFYADFQRYSTPSEIRDYTGIIGKITSEQLRKTAELTNSAITDEPESEKPGWLNKARKGRDDAGNKRESR